MATKTTALDRKLASLVSKGLNTYTRKAPTFGEEIEMTLSRESDSGHEYEIEVTVCGTALPFVHGRTQGDPDSCYPDEGGYAEDITAFFCRRGVWTEIELSDDESSTASERIMEQSGQDDGSADYEERDYDRRCDEAYEYDR